MPIFSKNLTVKGAYFFKLSYKILKTEPFLQKMGQLWKRELKKKILTKTLYESISVLSRVRTD